MTSTNRIVIKVFVAVALIIITALTLVAFFSLLPRPMPVFNFLGGQRPLHHVKNKSYRIDFYSFKADVNSIHIKANAELTSLGYEGRINVGQEKFFSKQWEWRFPGNSISVTIKNNRRTKVFRDPETSQYSSPDRYSGFHEDGWITVEVRQPRRNFWWWYYTRIR